MGNTNVLRPMVECPACDLPIPNDTDEFPYCNKTCFDAHVDRALIESERSEGKVVHVLEKIRRHTSVATPRHPKAHRIYCACHEC